MTEKLCKTCAYWKVNPCFKHIGECRVIERCTLEPNGNWDHFPTRTPTTGLSGCDGWQSKND